MSTGGQDRGWYDSERKMEDGRRLLGGEDLEMLSRELGVPVETLSELRAGSQNWGIEPIDLVVTEDRKKIHDLMSRDLKVAPTCGFACPDHESCNRSAKGALAPGQGRRGDWAYVGAHYGDAIVGGRKARVLFVSKDRPGRDLYRPFEVSQSKEDFRGSASPNGNPHMKGVYFELKHLLDEGVSDEVISHQFALVNAVLCGPVGTDPKSGKHRMTSRSTGKMQSNCRKNTARIIQTLMPDIVIVQGPRAQREGLRHFFSLVTIENWPDPHPELCAGEVEGKRVWFLLKRHPSRYNSSKRGFGPPALLEALTRLRECYRDSRTPA